MRESSLPVHLNPRIARQSRPSLAALTDSGYEPSLGTLGTHAGTLTTYNTVSTAPTKSTTTLLPNSLPSRTGRNTHSSLRREPIDLNVANQLLAEEALIKEINGAAAAASRRGSSAANTLHRAPSLQPAFDPVDGPASAVSQRPSFVRAPPSETGSNYAPGSGSVSRSATISSAWSGVSNRLFLESVRDAANERPMNTFTEQFDRLARKHGIQPFPVDFRAEPESVSVSSASRAANSGATTPPLGGNRFWNRLLRRTPSTVDVSKKHGNIKMTLSHKRNGSLGDLAAVGRGKRDSLKGMHLEDMIRLGGVAVFNLPLGLAPGDLLIPTCMHAAASYILSNGLRTAGIFRVSGNLSTTFALYDFYQRQLEENNNEAVVATTALARLPGNIFYTIHDVAHLFKKLIHGLPGGLLGSPAVFQALYNVHTFVYADPDLGDGMGKKVKPRMIALALASINLHFRIALICAVFGLLRAINLASEQTDSGNKVKDPHETFVAMKDDALGTVFGPLLLGDKSAHILVDETEDRGGLLVLPKVDPEANLARSKSKKGIDMGAHKREAEKARRAAVVCQMLIDNWEDICYQLKRINALGITAQAYDLPPQLAGDEEEEEDLEDSRTVYRKASTLTERHRIMSGKAHSMQEPEREHHHHPHLFHGHHSLNLPKSHMPHNMHSHLHVPKTKMQQQVEDLIAFSTRNSKDNRRTAEETFGELFRAPVLEEEEEPSRVGLMTPVMELPTPQEQSPANSPNWKLIGQATPLRARDPAFWKTKPEDSPNIRVIAPDTPLDSREASEYFKRPQTPTRKVTSSSGSSSGMDDGVTPRTSRNWEPVSTNSSPRSDITPQVAKRSPSSLFSRNISPASNITPQMAKRKIPDDISPSSSIEPQVARRRNVVSMLTDSSSSATPDMAPRIVSPLSFSGSTRSFSEDAIPSRPSAPTPLSAPMELGLRDISPLPPLTAVSREVQTEPHYVDRATTPDAHYVDRATTPEPLTVKKKKHTPASPPAFAIYQDREVTRPPTSPPQAATPLQPAAPNNPARPRRSATLDSTSDDRYFSADSLLTPAKKPPGNTALYAEIRRLQRLVEAKTEEAKQSRRELELAKRMASAGALGQMLRDAQEDVRVWRNRAEWAERELKRREREAGVGGDGVAEKEKEGRLHGVTVEVRELMKEVGVAAGEVAVAEVRTGKREGRSWRKGHRVRASVG